MPKEDTELLLFDVAMDFKTPYHHDFSSLEIR
jgi:hypothetical protein